MLKSLLKAVTPPFLVSVARRLIFAGDRPEVSKRGCLRPAEWYDRKYQSRKVYEAHYTATPYYFMWSVIVDRLRRLPARRVLDLGCGPGQFAALLKDQGWTEYCGLDFSAHAIETARRISPSFDFQVVDISKTKLPEKIDYDCAIALEVLEHVEDDIGLLERIKKGSHVLASVPSFASPSHLREFATAHQVARRYGNCFSTFHVDSFRLDEAGSMLYLIEGVKS